MAKVKEGARSQLSGKADGLVYVQFNGGIYTRKLPQSKKDPWTPGICFLAQGTTGNTRKVGVWRYRTRGLEAAYLKHLIFLGV